MAGRDIIVIGASAGGVQALQELARGLPHDLPAAVFVVVHTSPTSPGILPQIIDRAGPLPCEHARDGEPIRSGRILVAPPDHHLLIKDGHVRVTRGPKENGFRPAVDDDFFSPPLPDVFRDRLGPAPVRFLTSSRLAWRALIRSVSSRPVPATSR